MDTKVFYRILIFGMLGFSAVSFSANPHTSRPSGMRNIVNPERVAKPEQSTKAETAVKKEDAYAESVLGMEQAIQDTLADSEVSSQVQSDGMVSSEDILSDSAFGDSNLVHREWKRFRQFEERLFRSQLTKGEQHEQLKGYARDSLQILTVKLIATKRLEEKRLLELDIAKNPDYYLALLDELKASDISADNYLFLEKKLAYLTKTKVEQKYAWSKVVIAVLATGLLVFIVFSLRQSGKKTEKGNPDLSGQEKTIKSLILQGKTNKEIAAELFISVSTVKTHITHIYRKLNVGSRSELLRKMQN